MKFFYNLLAITLAALTLFPACDSSSSSTPDVSSQNGSADASGDEATLPRGRNMSVFSEQAWVLVTIKAKTPDNKPAKISVCQSWGCSEMDQHFENVADIDFTFKYLIDQFVTGDSRDFYVQIERQNYLFALQGPFTVNFKNGKKQSFTAAWTPGTFGLAPDGEYESKDGTEKKTLKTSVKDGKVVLIGMAASSEIPFGTYNTWNYENEKIYTYGEISDDLTKVTFYIKSKITSNEFSGTVLRK